MKTVVRMCVYYVLQIIFCFQSLNAADLDYCHFWGEGMVVINSKESALEHIESAIQLEQLLAKSENIHSYGFSEVALEQSAEKARRLILLQQSVSDLESLSDMETYFIIRSLNEISGLYQTQLALKEGRGSYLDPLMYVHDYINSASWKDIIKSSLICQ